MTRAWLSSVIRRARSRGVESQDDVHDLWRGAFGQKYIARNDSPELLQAERIFFQRALQGHSEIQSVLEFGANIGNNLAVIGERFPRARMAAVEINPAACGELRRRMPLVEVVQCEIESFESTQKFDLVLCKGVLIHQHPSSLPLIYKKLARAAARDVLLCEYFSAQPVSLRYRGVAGGIWKRDFAAEFLEVCSDFVLEDYGFVYHLDFRAQFDNFNWFLLRRRKAELASG